MIQSSLFDDEDDGFDVGKSIRNATYSMIKPELPEKRRMVFEVILANKSVTRKRIASILGWPINCVTGRVKELLDANLIKEEGVEYSPSHDGKMFPNGVLKVI